VTRSTYSRQFVVGVRSSSGSSYAWRRRLFSLGWVAVTSDPGEQKILGRTPAEHQAERLRDARQALEGFDPAAVLEDADLLEQVARRMFTITWKTADDTWNVAWENDAGSKDQYYGWVRLAASQLIEEQTGQ
jgi:hypothetical protein